MRLIRIDPMTKITDLGTPNNILSGHPKTGAANFYSDGQGRFHCGVWDSSPGKWAIHYTEEEFCLLLSGRAILADDEGKEEAFGPGDAFVIPAGFKGTWETTEPLRKYYVIFEH